MMQHAGTDNQIELALELTHTLEWQLPGFEIGEVVLLFQLVRVRDARRADVAADDVCVRVNDRVLGGLRRSASGNENVEICAVRPIGPQQVELGAMPVLIAPLVAGAVEVLHRRWIRMARVELADRIGVHARSGCLLCRHGA